MKCAHTKCFQARMEGADYCEHHARFVGLEKKLTDTLEAQAAVASKRPADANSETLSSFVEYCRTHPQMRFWQALRNWSGFPFIVAANRLPAETMDTFYLAGRDR